MIDTSKLPRVRRGAKSPKTYVLVDANSGERIVYHTRASLVRALKRAPDGSYVYLTQLGLRVPGVWTKRGGALVTADFSDDPSDPHSPAYRPHRFNPPRARTRRPKRQAKRGARRRFRRNERGEFTEVQGLRVRHPIGGYVYEVKYKDYRDLKNYKHTFDENNTTVFLAQHHSLGRCLLIASVDGEPLWEDA